MSIRLLIADDHAILRSGLRMLFAAQPDMEVVAEAADGAEALRKIAALRPEVVLLDISMPGPPTAPLVQEILRRAPGTRILVLTMHDDPAYMQTALAAGAAGFVVKRAADAELLTAIRAVHGGRTFVDLTHTRPSLGAPVVNPTSRDALLTPRERQVLGLLAQGNTNQEIGDQIGVSVKTVETYRSRLGDKLGLRGRAALFRYAVEIGLLDWNTAAPRSAVRARRPSAAESARRKRAASPRPTHGRR